MKNIHINNDDNYATPPELYDYLNNRFNFDFDPCPYNEGKILKNGLEIENALKAYHQKQTIGYIIQVIDHDGFGGDIEIIVGINLQKEITGVEILSIDETVGLGMNAKNEEFRNQYVGKKVDHFQVVKNGKQNEDEVDSLSGATITSKAMTNGINGALDFYDLLKGR